MNVSEAIDASLPLSIRALAVTIRLLVSFVHAATTPKATLELPCLHMLICALFSGSDLVFSSWMLSW